MMPNTTLYLVLVAMSDGDFFGDFFQTFCWNLVNVAGALVWICRCKICWTNAKQAPDWFFGETCLAALRLEGPSMRLDCSKGRWSTRSGLWIYRLQCGNSCTSHQGWQSNVIPGTIVPAFFIPIDHNFLSTRTHSFWTYQLTRWRTIATVAHAQYNSSFTAIFRWYIK